MRLTQWGGREGGQGGLEGMTNERTPSTNCWWRWMVGASSNNLYTGPGGNRCFLSLQDSCPPLMWWSWQVQTVQMSWTLPSSGLAALTDRSTSHHQTSREGECHPCATNTSLALNLINLIPHTHTQGINIQSALETPEDKTKH